MGKIRKKKKREDEKKLGGDCVLFEWIEIK